MQIRNPLRNPSAALSNSAAGQPANQNLAAPQPTLQQLQQALQAANQKIADLDARLRQLETGVYVAPNGDVEISATGNIRMVAAQRVEVNGSQGVSLTDALGDSFTLNSSGVTLMAPMKLAFTASVMEFGVAIGKFSGTVQCDTIIAVNVVGTSYTPGAGNIW